MPAAPSPAPPPAGARIRRPPGLQRQPPAAPHPHPRSPLPHRAHAPSHPIPGPGAPRSRRCLKGPQPDFQVGSASGPGAAGPVRMREARAASRVTAVPTVVLETGPLRLGKAGALRGGAWVSGLRGSCLTSPRGRQERLRTDAGSRNAPARMTKRQAESGGSGASSQPQACPDGVGVSLPKSLAPVISTTGPPACPWAALSPEGPSRPEQKPAASGGLCACGGCVSVPLLPCDGVCLRLSPPLLSLWPSPSVCVFPLFLPVCVCVPVCVGALGRMRPVRPKATSCASAWLCRASFFCLCAWVLRRARQWFSPPAVPLGVPEGLDRVRRCVFPGSSGNLVTLAERTLSWDQENHSPARAKSPRGARRPAGEEQTRLTGDAWTFSRLFSEK